MVMYPVVSVILHTFIQNGLLINVIPNSQLDFHSFIASSPLYVAWYMTKVILIL